MVKVISLSNEAYKKLKYLKGNKSFSEVVIDVTSNKKKKNIINFAGMWKDDANEWDKIKKKIYEDRKKFKLKTYKF